MARTSKLSNCLNVAAKFRPADIKELEDIVAASGDASTAGYIKAAQGLLASTRGLRDQVEQAAAAITGGDKPATSRNVPTPITPESPSAKPGKRPNKVEQADIEEVDAALERYSSAKKKDDATSAAQWIYDESYDNESARVREHARSVFENEVDRLTRDAIREQGAREGRGVAEKEIAGIEIGSIKLGRHDANLPTHVGTTPGGNVPAMVGRWRLASLAIVNQVRDAYHDVLAGPVGGLLRQAEPHLNGIVDSPNLQDNESGMMFTQHSVIALNPKNRLGARVLRITLAHELTHVLDRAAAPDGYAFASDAPGAVTGAFVESGPRGGELRMGPVMEEAFEYFDQKMRLGDVADPLTNALAYPLMSLRTEVWQTGRHGIRRDDVSGLHRPAEHASNELLPRLVELYYGNAETLRAALPKATQLIEDLNAAESIVDVQSRLLGTAGGEVSEEVRVHASAGAASKPGGVPSVASQGAGNGRGGSGSPAAPTDGGSPERLKPAVAREAARFNLPEPAEHGRMSHALNTVRGWVGDWRNRPGSLGWLSLRQLMDRFGRIESVQKFGRASLQMGQRAEQIMSEANAAIKPWQNLPADVQRNLGRLMLEATMDQVHPDKSFDGSENEHLRSTDRTLTEESRRTHVRLQTAYNALPQRAKEVYAKVRETAAAQWKAIGEARAKDIMRAFEGTLTPYFNKSEILEVVSSPRMRESMRRDVKEMPIPVSAKQAMRQLIEAAENNYREQQQMKGPYFPLVRNGEHVVVAKSEAFQTTAKKLVAARDELQRLYDLDPPADEREADELDTKVQEARDAVTAARGELETLKTSDRHYAVTFFEHRWEADAYRRQLESDPDMKRNGLSVKVEQRADHYRQFDGASPQFVRRLEEELRRALPKADLGAVQNAVREIYLRALPDRSALKSELRRLNVPGAKATEMMRGFAQRSMGNAFRISRMEHGGDLQDSLADMRGSDDRDEVILGQEMAMRLLKSMQPPAPNRLIEGVAQMTHLTFLGASPSYVLINASQPWVISLPIMSARHGWHRSAKALGDASAEVMRTVRALRRGEYDQLKTDEEKLAWLKSWRFDIQPEKLGNTEAEKRMLRELFNDGLINITIEHDLGAVSTGASQGVLGAASQLASTPAHVVEIVNRVATALAAFRLEQSRDASFDRSRDYATQLVADTHFDYSGENAPRLMRADSLGGLGRVVWQFKKYMQGMIYLIGKLLVEAKQGDKESLKALAYLHGLTIGVAGTAGLPIAGGVGLVFKAVAQLWEDDDEPDIAQWLYNGLKDSAGETAARLIVKGLPAAVGVDLSGRLGLGSLTNPLQYANTGNKEGRDLYASLLMAAGGPSSGMLANWFDAAQVSATDPVRAWQLVLPKVFSDPLKAMDRVDRGIQSRTGQRLVAPEEFDGLQSLMKAAGFESTDITDMYEKRSAFNAAKDRASDTRDTLVRRFLEAERDKKPTGDVMDEIAGFNRRNPNNRITAATLAQSRKQRAKADKETKDGIRVRKQERDLGEQLGI